MRTHPYFVRREHAAAVSGLIVEIELPSKPERGHVSERQLAALHKIVGRLPKTRIVPSRSRDPSTRQYPDDHEILVDVSVGFVEQ